MKLESLSYITSSGVYIFPTAGIIVGWFLIRRVGVTVYTEKGLRLKQSETPRELLKANCELVENASSHFLSHITTIKTVWEEECNESNLDS